MRGLKAAALAGRVTSNCHQTDDNNCTAGSLLSRLAGFVSDQTFSQNHVLAVVLPSLTLTVRQVQCVRGTRDRRQNMDVRKWSDLHHTEQPASQSVSLTRLDQATRTHLPAGD